MRAAPGRGRDLLSDLDPEREAPHDLVLGMPALFGIFIAVALICAVCFGFGYSSSRSFRMPEQRVAALAPAPQVRSTSPTPGPQTDPEAAPTAQEDAAEEAYPTPAPEKPAPGTMVAAPETPPEAPPEAVRTTPAVPSRSSAASSLPQNSGSQTVARTAVPVAPPMAASALSVTPVAPRNAAPLVGAETPAASAVPAPIGSGMMVQIAAVTRAADAQTLANALRHDGFDAIVRTSTGDPYFHVQIGPFASAQAAKSMRARLADSGYNAFIKP